MVPKIPKWLVTSSLMLLVTTACVGCMNLSVASTEQPAEAPGIPTANLSNQEPTVTPTPRLTITPLPHCPSQTSDSISFVSMAVYNNVNTASILGRGR